MDLPNATAACCKMHMAWKKVEAVHLPQRASMSAVWMMCSPLRHEYVAREEHRLRLVALPPSAVRPGRALALLRRPLMVRPPSWPFFSASLVCQACPGHLLANAPCWAFPSGESLTAPFCPGHCPFLALLLKHLVGTWATSQGSLRHLIAKACGSLRRRRGFWLARGKLSPFGVQDASDADMLCQALQYTTQRGRALTFSPVLERQLLPGRQ